MATDDSSDSTLVNQDEKQVPSVLPAISNKTPAAASPLEDGGAVAGADGKEGEVFDATLKLPNLEDLKSDISHQRDIIRTQLKHRKPLTHREADGRQASEPESEPDKREAVAIESHKRARSRIRAARHETDLRVAEATKARLKHQAEACAASEQMVEKAQQEARRRVAHKSRERVKRSPLLEKQAGSATAAVGEDTDTAQHQGNDEELPARGRSKARVKKQLQKQRVNEEVRRLQLEEEMQRQEQLRQEQAKVVEARRLQHARRAAERHRQEKEAEAKVKAEREEAERQARERQKVYRTPRKIAEFVSASDAASPPKAAQAQRLHDRRKESHMQRERERARRYVDGDKSLEPMAFGEPEPPRRPKMGHGKQAVQQPEEESLKDNEEFFARTVQALTDEEWTVNIKIC